MRVKRKIPVPGSAVFYYGTGLAPPSSFLSYPGHPPVDWDIWFESLGFVSST